MFSFFLHHQKPSRRFVTRLTIAAAVLFSLSLLFTGCSMGGGEGGGGTFVDNHELNEDLIGTWESGEGDAYTVTENHITYSFGEFITYAGTIEYVSNFYYRSGVIIIKYDADHQQKYYAEYDSKPPYGPIGDPLSLNGDYLGIYFKALRPGVSFQMGGAYTAPGGAEEATLEKAKAAFTLGNTGKYMSSYGTYEKQ